MHDLSMRIVPLLVLAAGLASLTCPAAVAAETPPGAASAPSDVDLASTECAIGEEQFLPADYYYCLAMRSYGEHDYVLARRFFTTAASWASKPAQYVLGIMAQDGDHQPVDRPLAAAWLALASERPQSPFAAASASLHASLTPAERQAGDKLLARMRGTYGDATAAVRAEQRYTLGMARLTRLSAGDSRYCIAGMADASGPDMASDPQQCPPIQPMIHAIDQIAAKIFDGWAGHVSVGPLQPVASPVAAHRPG